MRAFGDMVVLRPREDLERNWNSSVLITPDSALVSADHMTGLRHDHTAIAEVFRVPDGLEGLAPGDGVLLPLYSMSKVVVIDRETYLVANRKSICAKITALGQASEKLEALNGWMITRRDREAFQNRMYSGMLLTDQEVDDGIPLDGGSEGIVRGVLERTVSVGTVYLNPALQKPKQREGELAFFNPIASCRFRRFGVNYRLVHSDDVQFALED